MEREINHFLHSFWSPKFILTSVITRRIFFPRATLIELRDVLHDCAQIE